VQLILYILQRPRLALLQAFAVTEAELEAFLKVAAQSKPSRVGQSVLVAGVADVYSPLPP
jgi:hypothetical protein